MSGLNSLAWINNSIAANLEPQAAVRVTHVSLYYTNHTHLSIICYVDGHKIVIVSYNGPLVTPSSAALHPRLAD